MKFLLRYILFILIQLSVISAQTDSTKIRIFTPDSSIVKIDSSKINSVDSLKTIMVQDTIKPVFIEAYDDYTILTKKEIDRADYRYTGNLFTSLPYGHLNDLGQYLLKFVFIILASIPSPISITESI